jgi:hypothetical protein
MLALQVIRSIGSGSFGCALLCREKSSGTMVVIKQVSLCFIHQIHPLLLSQPFSLLLFFFTTHPLTLSD